tara:strand:+ start:44 stop:220 length:177 start_codon:yes stop_codon:yes gene_type:complete
MTKNDNYNQYGRYISKKQKKRMAKKVEDPYFRFNRKLNPYCKPDDGVNWDSSYGKKYT